MRRPLALVTGGSRRVGAAIVETLAARDFDVVIHYHRSRDDADALADRLRKAGAYAWTIRADLRHDAQTEALVRRAAGLAERPVELLVNNASEFPSTSAENATWEAVEASMRVHHWAPLVLTRALADQAVPASVVNILDSTQPEHDLDHFAYQAGKNALASLTRVTAAGLAPTVRVNAVAPGAILQPAGEDPALLDKIARGLPLHRHGSPQDVADAVLYLATAPFVTGVTLRVDGGAHLLGSRDA